MPSGFSDSHESHESPLVSLILMSFHDSMILMSLTSPRSLSEIHESPAVSRSQTSLL